MSESTSIYDLIRNREEITRELGQKIDGLIREAICIRTGNAKNHFRTKYIPREKYDLFPEFVQLARGEIILLNYELFVHAVTAYRNRTGASLFVSKLMIDAYREPYKNIDNTNQEKEHIMSNIENYIRLEAELSKIKTMRNELTKDILNPFIQRKVENGHVQFINPSDYNKLPHTLQLNDAERSYAADGMTIKAIKCYRERTHAGLLHSKMVVDAFCTLYNRDKELTENINKSQTTIGQLYTGRLDNN